MILTVGKHDYRRNKPNPERDIVQHKAKNTYNPDYNEAFKKIDDAIADMAHKVFYDCDKKSYDYAYQSFEEFDHISAIVNRQRLKKLKPAEA